MTKCCFKLFDTLIVILKESIENVDFEKKTKQQIAKINYGNFSMQRVRAASKHTRYIILYLIETPFNTFANRVDPDQAALKRAA